MSATMQDTSLITRGKPIIRRPARTSGIRHTFRTFVRWAAARPTLTAVTLTLVYLATLAAVVGVLMASASDTLGGTAILALFAAEVLVFLAIAVYVVIPER